MLDFVLIHGRIWTPGLPRAEALAAAGGRIIAVGRDRDIAELIGPATRVLDAEGRRVIPGLIDAHMHFVPGGLQLTRLDLSRAAGRADFTSRIERYASAHPGHGWIEGGGWSNDFWPDRAEPRCDWVDPFTADRPLFLHRMDRHAGLANSAALADAGISRNGPADPPGGRIDRDPRTHEPTGVLRDAAMKLVADRIPPPTPSQRDEAIRLAARHANAHGLTMVHNMLDAADLKGGMGKGLRLPVRMFNILHQRPDAAGIESWRSLQPGDDRLRCGACKNYMDGSLGSRTAWMLDPYADRPPADRGLRIDGDDGDEALLDEWLAADRAGLQLCAHAIGDAANRRLLELYQAVERRNGPRDRRPRLEHAQHLDAADVPRFARIGAIASMQPLHKHEDGAFVERALGVDRARTSYRFRDLLAAGAVLAFGSDWPIVSLNPFEGIHAAVTGRVRGGGVWLPEQNLSVADALRAYTCGAAYSCFMEDRLGKLLPGCYADLAVLDRDILTIDPDAIRETKVAATVVGGEMVYPADHTGDENAASDSS